MRRGPLFPLSSLMLHGIIYSQHARDLDTDPGGDLRDEIRTFFASGTQLQEMYITPSLMSDGNWDDLAQAARWARERATILQDSHWVGGDPEQAEIYGWAAWSGGHGVLALRNPGSLYEEVELDIGDVFELPAGAPTRYTLISPYGDQRIQTLEVSVGSPQAFGLRPLEVLVFDALPAE